MKYIKVEDGIIKLHYIELILKTKVNLPWSKGKVNDMKVAYDVFLGLVKIRIKFGVWGFEVLIIEFISLHLVGLVFSVDAV